MTGCERLRALVLECQADFARWATKGGPTDKDLIFTLLAKLNGPAARNALAQTEEAAVVRDRPSSA